MGIVISSLISAIATCIIAYFTWQNYKMYQILKGKDEEYKNQTSDLYQEIVIATLLSGPTSYGDYPRCKDKFKGEYAGKTEIFKH